jgi:predicted dinucleotide-utilizing enzyme
LQNAAKAPRIGIAGFGYVGKQLYDVLTDTAGQTLGLEPAFVWARRAERLSGVDASHRLDDLSGFATRRPTLIVEAAHPDVTRRHGANFLTFADYMPLSVSALADAELHEALAEAARRNGTRLLLPAGALVGAASLVASRSMWRDVTITFRKNPLNIDFSESGIRPETIARAQTVFEGPVREIALLFPRNVNTMVTCALATVGLDRCIGRLVADPDLDCAIAEVEAVGRDGSVVRTQKHQPAIGVSGTEMFASLLHSVKTGLGRFDPIDVV